MTQSKRSRSRSAPSGTSKGCAVCSGGAPAATGDARLHRRESAGSGSVAQRSRDRAGCGRRGLASPPSRRVRRADPGSITARQPGSTAEARQAARRQGGRATRAGSRVAGSGAAGGSGAGTPADRQPRTARAPGPFGRDDARRRVRVLARASAWRARTGESPSRSKRAGVTGGGGDGETTRCSISGGRSGCADCATRSASSCAFQVPLGAGPRALSPTMIRRSLARVAAT